MQLVKLFLRILPFQGKWVVCFRLYFDRVRWSEQLLTPVNDANQILHVILHPRLRIVNRGEVSRKVEFEGGHVKYGLGLIFICFYFESLNIV